MKWRYGCRLRRLRWTCRDLGRDGLTLDWQALKGRAFGCSRCRVSDRWVHDWSDGQWFLVQDPRTGTTAADFAGLSNYSFPVADKSMTHLIMRVPQNPRERFDTAAKSHLTTSSDYHLRWRRASYVNRMAGADGALAAPTGRRSDRFQFDRQEFELPLWLASQEREIRMSSAATMTIRNGLADIEMQVRLSGSPPEGRVQVSDAGWDILDIVDGSNDQSLESYRTDSGRTIEVGGDAAGGPMTIRLSGQRPLANDWGQVAIPIPTVSLDGETPAAGPSTLDIVGTGRTRLVVNLTATEGLSRVGTGGGPNSNAQETSRFRINTRQSSAVIIGKLVDQPPRIALVAGVTVELDDQNLATDVFWNVRSPMDLEGRLPVRFSTRPQPDSGTDDDSNGNDGLDRKLNEPKDEALESWAVTVDGVPAILQAADSGEYEVVSERLSSGAFTIAFRHIQLIPTIDQPELDDVNLTEQDSNQPNSDRRLTRSSGPDESHTITLPRPNISDITLDRPISITLSGNERYELLAQGEKNNGELTLARFPIESLPFRFRERKKRSTELQIENVVLRSIASQRIRHEHLIARVGGANRVKFQLSRWNGSEFVMTEGEHRWRFD